MSVPTLIYDDSLPIPPEVRAITGLAHFGDLLHRKVQVARKVTAAAAAAGLQSVVTVRDAAALRRVVTDLAADEAGTRYLYFPANLILGGAAQALADLFGKLRYLRQNAILTVSADADRWCGAACLDRDTLRSFLDHRAAGTLARFVGDHQGSLREIGNGAGLLDLAKTSTLLEYLTSTFEVRHFNAIAFDAWTVRKSSTDKAKIRREYATWGLLPESMKYWFVQPFDLRDEGDRASYAMERLNIPDAALQWVHGAFDDAAFARFLDRAFHFLESRTSREATPAETSAIRTSLYRDKVSERLDALRAHPAGQRIATILPFDALETRYRTLLDRLEPRRSDTGRLVVGHGDFCFSNILYEKSSGLMRLIDPRGAETEAALWTDPYYDAAKLSHSVQGGYDFITNGLFDVVLDDTLAPSLALPLHAPLADRQAGFRDRLAAAGFDPLLVRLYEASLFLSMGPLHIDIPAKTLAFLLIARSILDEVAAALR